MTLRCGNISEGTSIGVADLNILLSSGNFMESVHDAENKLADLDGDGQIGITDLNILLNPYNFMQGEIMIGLAS
jgi:hypothetical protein